MAVWLVTSLEASARDLVGKEAREGVCENIRHEAREGGRGTSGASHLGLLASKE